MNEKYGRKSGSAVMNASGMYGDVPAESTLTASSSSCGVSSERPMLSIGRVSDTIPARSPLKRSNHRKADGKPAHSVVQIPNSSSWSESSVCSSVVPVRGWPSTKSGRGWIGYEA